MYYHGLAFKLYDAHALFHRASLLLILGNKNFRKHGVFDDKQFSE